MTTVAVSRPVTDAVIAALQAAGLVVGDGEAPGPSPPYVVVQPVGGRLGGPVGDPHADAVNEVQVTSWGALRSQAEETRDRARAALLPRAALAVVGRHAWWVDVVVDRGAPREDTTAAPPLWQAVDVFAIHTSPQPGP